MTLERKKPFVTVIFGGRRRDCVDARVKLCELAARSGAILTQIASGPTGIHESTERVEALFSHNRNRRRFLDGAAKELGNHVRKAPVLFNRTMPKGVMSVFVNSQVVCG